MLVLENQLEEFSVWLPTALRGFALSLLILGFVMLLVGYAIAAVRSGPLAGGDAVFSVVRSFFAELLRISPRRIWAIARLAIKESLRKKVLAVLVINVLMLLFANFLLDPTTNDPATLYLRFLLNTSFFLVILAAMLMSSFSLPADFKSKTIFTIVTKPVSTTEIVVGRVLGFSLVTGMLLAAMGAMNYLFVIRALSHTHTIDPAALTDVSSKHHGETLWVGKTSSTNSHRHYFSIDHDGNGSSEFESGHYHQITSHQENGQTMYDVGPAVGMFTARVPVYGTLSFLDRAGQKTDKGLNVGNEWTYRSFIEGRTRQAGIFHFKNLKPEQCPDGILPLAMTIRVFRSYKGDIQKGIRGSLQLRNPETLKESAPIDFTCKDAQIDEKDLVDFKDRKSHETLDLFKDLVASDGRLDVVVRCEAAAQYFGLAAPDMWIRAGERSFELNYLKGYLSLYLRVVIVIGFGVMFSTFLAGPVAIFATVCCLLFGLSRGFVTNILQLMMEQKVTGGGPIESIVRILTQANMVQELEESWTNDLIKNIDKSLFFVMEKFTWMLPNLSDLGNHKLSEFLETGLAAEIEFVARGFDISGDQLLIRTLTTLGYMVGMFLVGGILFKTREVAR